MAARSYGRLPQVPHAVRGIHQRKSGAPPCGWRPLLNAQSFWIGSLAHKKIGICERECGSLLEPPVFLRVIQPRSSTRQRQFRLLPGVLLTVPNSAEFRRSRMISFRLSPEDYGRFARMCAKRGVGSISDMARLALQKLVAEDADSDPVSFELRDLRTRVKAVASEVERLAEIVEGRKAMKASG
jgi:hypothetical protein